MRSAKANLYSLIPKLVLLGMKTIQGVFLSLFAAPLVSKVQDPHCAVEGYFFLSE